MSDVNISIVQGRLTHNPELRKTPSGSVVTDIQIASNRFTPKKDTKPGEEQKFNKYTTYVRVTLWNKLAERYADPKSKSFLHKGDMVVVEGQLVDDNYEKDGAKTTGRIKIDNVNRVNLVTRAAAKPAVAETTSTTEDFQGEPEETPVA